MIDPEKAPEAENAESRGSQKEDSDTNQTGADRPQALLGWISRIPQLFSFSWLYAIPFICLLGVGGVLIYVSQVPSGVRWSTLGAALAIGSAAFFTGGLVGFLFGIPRAVQGSTPSTGVTDYQANTNLEQVSDWLTKIIIGVTLTQLGRIAPALSKFADSIKAPLGGLASSGDFGLGLAISYAALGFFYLYLWSRSLLARELGIYQTPQQVSVDSQQTGSDAKQDASDGKQ
jgi:hypothetical protein